MAILEQKKTVKEILSEAVKLIAEQHGTLIQSASFDYVYSGTQPGGRYVLRWQA